jgi:phospholipid/cholesterol/gamma-HCH transport system ATP-binding protein
MIVFEQVHFYFGDHHVVRDISFQVESGTTRVILGASGSGKSTLLRLMLGFYLPSSGRVLIDGRDTARLSGEELRELRKEFGMVFQEGALFDSMTVGENVGYGLFEERRMLPEEIESRVREILNFLGLGEQLIDRMPDQLSGGMQRRVAVGRAIAAHNPRFMLYDEPTTGLDPLTVETITELIIRLKEEKGLTSVVVTHELIDALKVGDSFLVLNEGQVMFDGTDEELRHTSQPYVLQYLAPFRKALKEHALV